MDALIMRSLVGFLAVGLAVGGPMPLAVAQIEVTPEIRQACEKFDPEIREIALNDVVPKLEESNKPDASPEAKAEAQGIERTATTIHRAASETVANLAVPDRAALEQTLTQRGGVTAPVAQEMAQKAQTAMQEAKAAFAAGEPLKAEAVLTSFQHECRVRYQVDPSVLGGSARDSHAMTFDRIAFGAPDVIGHATECHMAGESLRQAGVEFHGAPPSAEQARDIIAGMNVSPDEKAKMLEIAKVYEGFARDGNFAGIREMQVAAAQEAYRQATESGRTPGGTAVTPEMAKQMAAEMARNSDVVGPMIAYHDWAAANPELATAHPEYATMATARENLRTLEAAAATGTSGREVMEQMARTAGMAREIYAPTQDAPRTEMNGSSQTTFENQRTLVAQHDHNSDGHFEHFHYDTNRDGIADTVETVGS